MNATLTLTYFLVGALLTNVLLKLWLNARQVRHVARHRGAVPTAFASQISLADHQKAADYTLAKAKEACQVMLKKFEDRVGELADKKTREIQEG